MPSGAEPGSFVLFSLVGSKPFGNARWPPEAAMAVDGWRGRKIMTAAMAATTRDITAQRRQGNSAGGAARERIFFDMGRRSDNSAAP